VARVLDASVLLHWLADEPLSAQARALLASQDDLLAPVLARSEVGNGLWMQVRCGRMTIEEASVRMEALADSGVRFVDDPALQVAALHIGARLEHPAYDWEYVALAIAEGCDLVTADDALWQRACEIIGERAVWLSDV